jgi:predicted RNA binding protein YcfA (HicA-like mRNA interferase family)
MRIPRDVSGAKLAQRLEKFGCTITCQTGSHLRLTTTINGEHHITIPNHKEIRLGTISAILSDVADHLGMERDVLVESLF